MPLSYPDIEKRHDEAKAARVIEEPAWRDLARLLRPDEQDFSANETVDRDTYDVFDSTALYAVDDYAAGMFAENTNPAERWMEFTTGDDDLDKWGPAQAWLWGEASLLFRSFSPAISTFYQEAPAWFANLGVFGNGFMSQEEWEGRNRTIERHIPIGQSYIALDPAGDLELFNREFKMTGRQMRMRWGDAARDCDEACSYTILHSVYANLDYRPGRLGDKPFASTHVSPDKKTFRVDAGFYEMPYHPVFWNMRSSRPWATGPGHTARADINSNNEIARSNLIDAQFAAEPPLLTTKEGVFTAADIVPNAILDGGLSEQGKELVKPMQRGDNPQRAEAKHEQLKAAIKDAFYFSILQVRNRPQMTATEFLGWKEERLRQLAPYLVRVQKGLASLVARRYRILGRAGQTTPAPPELQNRNLAIKFVSPLAKAQELATARAVLQWVGALGTVSQASGDPSVMDIVNKDGVARVTHKAMVGMPDVINDQKTVAQIRQQRAAQQAQQQEVEQQAQQASTFADVAHAAQAMTLSKTRSAQKAN